MHFFFCNQNCTDSADFNMRVKKSGKKERKRDKKRERETKRETETVTVIEERQRRRNTKFNLQNLENL